MVGMSFIYYRPAYWKHTPANEKRLPCPLSMPRVQPRDIGVFLALAKYEAVDQYWNNPPRLLEGSGNITLFLWQKTWVVVAKQYWYEG